MAGKDPAMPFYVNDWLSSPRVMLMTLEQQGAFLRLLCLCWASQDASLPGDDETLARLSGLGEGWFKGGSEMVGVCFTPHPHKKGFVTNGKLFQLWSERQEWRRKSAEGGRKSAKARGLNAVKGGSTVVQPPYEPKGNSSSSSLSLSSSSNSSRRNTRTFVRPTLEEARAYCVERGNSVDVERWFDHYESNGWMVGRSGMKDWKAAIRNWERNQVGPGARLGEPDLFSGVREFLQKGEQP